MADIGQISCTCDTHAEPHRQQERERGQRGRSDKQSRNVRGRPFFEIRPQGTCCTERYRHHRRGALRATMAPDPAWVAEGSPLARKRTSQDSGPRNCHMPQCTIGRMFTRKRAAKDIRYWGSGHGCVLPSSFGGVARRLHRVIGPKRTDIPSELTVALRQCRA